jgi:predicted 3-demethylubiquinone-9 3-methyltransferase (glyoxalase superfamily)
MMLKQRLTPCLWFDHQAEDAASFYVGIFRNAKVNNVARYPNAGQEIHGQKAGSVMTVDFELDGLTFTALNGGPHFRFNEAVSFQVMCEDQKEIDYYWEKLGAGGDPNAQQCGWLKDRFGLSWQVVPRGMESIMKQPGAAGERAMAAMLKMKKIDIAGLERAATGD